MIAEEFRGPNPTTIYAALVTGVLDGGLTNCAAHSIVTRAIDALQAEPDAAAQIKVLEEVSVQLHMMQQDLRDGYGQATPRARIAALTDQWLSLAVIAR